MKKLIYLSFSIALFAIAITYTSCKKDKEDKDTQSALDQSTAQNAFDGIFKEVDNGIKQRDTAVRGSRADTSICATITLSSFHPTPTNPATLTIDFHNGCLGNDGVFRSGKIIAVITGKYDSVGTIVTITPQNYYHNGILVEGTKTITNMGHVGTTNGTHNMVWHVVVANGKLTSSNKQVITWQSTQDIEWIEGESTHWPFIADDIILLTGSGNGTNVNGNNFSARITKALRIARACKWIESGTIVLTPADGVDRTVDFGDGTCDGKLTVTISGKIYEVILP
ncbi:MAG: hypothetical protein WC223_10125 [Bacteroidales bacterium]